MPVSSDAVRFWEEALYEAILLRATDVHFEPMESGARLRYRVDGFLQNAALPRNINTEQVVSRIKVLSQLDIAEKRTPQDGRMDFRPKNLKLSSERGAERDIDIRTSTLPTVWGEKVVLRILDNQAVHQNLPNLGMTSQDEALLRQAIEQPNGLILVTGPTGSGKTATLYACLRDLNHIQRNICTVEDPVEIHLEGINQVHVNERAGLSFASAMRAFLRQDPDVMMVGEMRDEQSASIAIKAAQTGHLVLSTLHTNDAPSTIERLRHLGVENYQIANGLRLVCAQRLLRRLCAFCKQHDHLSAAQGREGFFLAHPQGCPHCQGGYHGRVAIFQMMPITEALQHRILMGDNAQDLEALARQHGMLRLDEAGMAQAAAGHTSLAEVQLHT